MEESPPLVDSEEPAPEQDDPTVGSEDPGADEVPNVGSGVHEQEEVPSPAESADIEEVMRQNHVSDQHEFIDNLYYSMFPGENAPPFEEDFAEVLNATQSQ